MSSNKINYIIIMVKIPDIYLYMQQCSRPSSNHLGTLQGLPKLNLVSPGSTPRPRPLKCLITLVFLYHLVYLIQPKTDKFAYSLRDTKDKLHRAQKH